MTHARNVVDAAFGSFWAPSTSSACRLEMLIAYFGHAVAAGDSAVTGSELVHPRPMRRIGHDQLFAFRLLRLSSMHKPMLTRNSTGMIAIAIMKSPAVTPASPCVAAG